MSQETETQTTETTTASTETTDQNQNTETQQTEGKTYTEAEFKKLASEKKAYEDKLRTLEANEKKRTDAEALAKGETEKLYNQEKAAREAAEKERDEIKAAKEEIETETRKELMSRLDKDGKEFAKDLSISKLREYVKISGKTSAPPSDNGKGATTGDVKLTDAQKREAEIMGLDDKSYFEVMEKRKQNLENKK